MKLDGSTIRLFQRAVACWVLLFTVSAYGGPDRLLLMCVAPSWDAHAGYLDPTRWLSLLHGVERVWSVGIAACVLVLLCVRDLVRTPHWWSAFGVWLLYTNLMHQAWLGGSGGQQLMANVLFWNILLAFGSPVEKLGGVLRHMAFWVIRLQLLLAYFATGLHKLMGTHWPEGQALGIVASDPAFGPAWMLQLPWLAMLLTWCVLLFQLSFPVAIWFSRTRVPWMVFGILFHLGTALWMDIPEMALAFIACYAIWLDPRTIAEMKPLRWLARSPSTAADAELAA